MISMTATLSADLDPRTTEFIARPQQMYVDGQWVESATGRRFDTVDPATEQVITTVPHSDVEDVERAVRAARRAFEDGPWPAMTRPRPPGSSSMRCPSSTWSAIT